MHKNTAMIEETMANSYQLYSKLQEQQVDSELTRHALTVAKDIHEIKKEYQIILRGISEALELNLKDEKMSLSDILRVLQNSLMMISEEKNISLNIHTNIETNFFTDKHYFLLSIFRNLFTNALEAAQKTISTLSFTAKEQGNDYLFEITDDGPGISSQNLPYIFHPGFSTKINFETGEISRGLGLNLVEDIVANQLHGTIHVKSCPGDTTFYITIPKEELEVF